jgi:hypothetical protein
VSIPGYDSTGLKLEGAVFERAFLRSAAAAAAFSASCFANRKAALLFVRGAMDGLAQTLLGRGLGLMSGVSVVLSAVFGLVPFVGLEDREGRAATEDGRETA